jgi:hypothetical protein
MADQSRLERRLDTAVARTSTPRGATIVIATVSTVITVGGGLLMTVVDAENFPSIGSGLWWADPVVALFVAHVAIHEGREALRGDAAARATR